MINQQMKRVVKFLSIYMIVTFSFVGLGQFLLNLSDPAKVDLFILVSILLSFALLPILLSITEAPKFDNPKRLKLKELFVISPLGFVGAFFIGLAHSVIFGYGAVYAIAKGLSIFEISIFMVIVSIFGAIFQWPIGFLSDRIDRRIILISVTLIASCLSIFIIISSYLSLVVFFIVLAFYAGMSLPMHSLAVAHTNDFLQPDEIVAASSAINILVGIGAILGPITSFIIYERYWARWIFCIPTYCSSSFRFVWSLQNGQKNKTNSDIESQYVPLPRNISAAGMELNPKVENKED